MHEITFRLISAVEASRVAEGTIMFLPPHDQIPKTAYTDPLLNIGAYNHPVVILSCPSKDLKLDSHVKIAIVSNPTIISMFQSYL
jgi:hypothetical protein